MFTQQQLKKRRTSQNVQQKKHCNAKQAIALCHKDIIFTQGVTKSLWLKEIKVGLVLVSIKS